MKRLFTLLAALLLAPASHAAPDPRFSIRSGDKFGAIDATGKIVIEPQYDDELVFSDGMARVRVGSKLGFIDATGKVLISPKLTLAQGSGDFAQEVSLAGSIVGEFAEGLAVYELDGKQGYLDRNGAVAVPAQFVEAGNFADGRALVRTSKGYGQIDRSGKFLIEPRFERPFFFQEGLAVVLVPGKGFGYIDPQARFRIEPQYNYAYNFSDGRARAQVEGGYGYIDTAGKLVIEPTESYKLQVDFIDGVAKVNVAGKGWGLIGTDGKFVVEPQFFSIGQFSEGLAPVAVGDFQAHRWGYMDAKGALVVQAEYARSEPFAGGFGQVRLAEGGTGFVDRSGKLAIGPLKEYTQVDAFRDGLARVWFSSVTNSSGSWGYIDARGKLVWKPSP